MIQFRTLELYLRTGRVLLSSPLQNLIGHHICLPLIDPSHLQLHRLVWCNIYSASYFKNWRFVWGTKPPWRQDWWATDVYFENCVTKPCQVGHRPYFDAQRWSQLLTFDGKWVEQLHSVQPMPSCTVVLIKDS